MPNPAANATKTPIRNVRVPDDVWYGAAAIAAANDDTLSQVIRRALTAYIAEHTP